MLRPQAAAHVILVCGVLTACTGGDAPAPAPATRSEVVTTTPPTPATESNDVANALSALATSPETLIASGAGITAKQARQVFPGATRVVAHPQSWAPDGTGSGGVIQVTVTPPGRGPRSYLAIMVKESGLWRVMATVPVAEPSAAGNTP